MAAQGAVTQAVRRLAGESGDPSATTQRSIREDIEC